MKMWCLINKNNGRVIKIHVDACGSTVLAVGFHTKKDLMDTIETVESDEVVKRVDFKV